jgi:hypothetical protein
MAEDADLIRIARRVPTKLGSVGLIEAGQFLHRYGDQEGLEKDNRFAETGVEVEMGGIQDLPQTLGADYRALGKFRGCFGELAVEVRYHLVKCGELVEKLRAVGQ